MHDQRVSFSLHDGVATVTLCCPQRANSIDVEMARQLHDAALRCDTDEVRVVLLRAEGPIFCAGGDVKSFGNAGDALPGLLAEILEPMNAAVACFSQMNAPLIIAVGGTAAGGGLGLACSGDFVIAADNARFAIAYTRIGMTPDVSTTYFVPRRIGVARTRQLLLCNPVLDAATALEWGLVERVVAAADLDAEAIKLATEFAAGPTQAYGAVKRLLLETLANDLKTQLDLEARTICEMGAGSDGKEGIRALLEKRAPRFGGSRR